MFKVCGFCGIEFQTKKKNQKYCDQMCCRGATNKRIMQKYYENKARLKGFKRYCECGQLLSKYNAGTMCNICENKMKINNRDKISEAIKVVTSKTGKAKG
jgi:hypothetical protein